MKEYYDILTKQNAPQSIALAHNDEIEEIQDNIEDNLQDMLDNRYDISVLKESADNINKELNHNDLHIQYSLNDNLADIVPNMAMTLNKAVFAKRKAMQMKEQGREIPNGFLNSISDFNVDIMKIQNSINDYKEDPDNYMNPDKSLINF